MFKEKPKWIHERIIRLHQNRWMNELNRFEVKLNEAHDVIIHYNGLVMSKTREKKIQWTKLNPKIIF